MAEDKVGSRDAASGETSAEARVGAAMKAARENYRDPRDPGKLSRRELARRLYMSHSNLTDYENGHRFPPAEVVQAYERELKLLPGSLIDLWEQSRVELLGEMRTRQRRWCLLFGSLPRAPRQISRGPGRFPARLPTSSAAATSSTRCGPCSSAPRQGPGDSRHPRCCWSRRRAPARS